MEELSELGHRDLVAGLVTLEGKKSHTKCIFRNYRGRLYNTEKTGNQ